MAAYNLRDYDGVLTYGKVLRDLYLENGWTQRAWTWHEAADVRVFRPHPEIKRERDLVGSVTGATKSGPRSCANF